MSASAYAPLRWWREEQPGPALATALSRLRQRQSVEEDALVRWQSLYGGSEYAHSLRMRGYQIRRVPDSDRLSYNVVASVIDTLHAEVIQGRPRPMFVTTGGQWELQERAKKLTQFCAGTFEAHGVEDEAERAALDALVGGTGAIKVTSAHGKLAIERSLPGDLWVDDRDGWTGRPRTLYECCWVDRAVLSELYPEHADEIATARPVSGWTIGYDDSDSDQVLLTEAWHLASGPEADDGRHVIAVADRVLLDEPWTREGFPFAFLRWKTPLFGFWGAGVPEALDGLQCEINRLARDIQRAQYLMGSPKYLVPRGARLVKRHLDNEPGAIIEYDGPTKPEVWTGAAVPRDTTDLVERHYAKAFQLIGVSQMAAQSLKPAGIDSGVALRTYLDNQSKRFLRFARDYERFHVELARLVVREMRALAEDDSSVEVVYREGQIAERISWRDCDLDDDAFVINVFPVSALSNSPSGRLQQATELFERGIFDQQTFLLVTDLPDLKAQRDLLTAPRELIEQRVQRMIADGVYLAPTPFMDLKLALLITGLAYQRFELQGVSDERLALLRQFLDDCAALLEQASGAAAPAPAAAAPSEAAAPAPAPPAPTAAMAA